MNRKRKTGEPEDGEDHGNRVETRMKKHEAGLREMGHCQVHNA